MKTEKIDDILKYYVPSCMDKVVAYETEKSLEMGPPSEEYLEKMNRLVKRMRWKEKYFIPVKTSQRIVSAILVFLVTATVLTFSVSAIRNKVFEVIHVVYEKYTMYQYELQEGNVGKFVPMYPTYLPEGYRERTMDTGDNYSLQDYYNETTGKSIVIDEERIEDGTRIYEDNEFITEEKQERDGIEYRIGIKEDEIVIVWEKNGNSIALGSDLMDKETLLQVAAEMKTK